MIPKNIKREHVIKAMEGINKVGIPKGRSSKKFLLEYEGKHYPPKYIISLANSYANSVRLDSSEFGGGKETNDFLRVLGFNIVEVSSSKKANLKSLEEHREINSSKVHHDERCSKCKETIGKLLEKIYGRVEQNYKFEVGTLPENFVDTLYYGNLKQIYEALQNYRGFREFVKAKTLPTCDFFVANPRFIVEFDESQHFTVPRKITLENYPEELKLGFDRKSWIKLCEKINRKDNDPPYRDEQRAWYDTVRDFLPAIKGLNPTIRLFASDFVWCSLDPDKPSDVKRFENLLKRTSQSWEIEVIEEPNPYLARIIIAGEWEGKSDEAKKLLADIYEKWPKNKRVKFIITCGGFVQFAWPQSISTKDIGDNKNPNEQAVGILVEKAEKCARHVFDGLNEKLSKITDYITLGIDSYKQKISTTQNYIGQPHIELVFLIDLPNNKFYWTGKSYPTPKQENGLVRISNLKSHFFGLDDVEKLMILGCHDLSIFNPRGTAAAKGWRKNVNTEFKRLAKNEKPIYALQHPHTTVKVRTWLNAWNCLKRILPSVKLYAAAGRFHEPDRKSSEYDALENVLQSTKCGNTIDFIVKKSG